MARRWAGIFGLYLLAAWLLHGFGVNLWTQMLGGGDSYTAGLPSKLFATSLSPWNPYVQLGQYTFANTQFQALYPPALLAMSALPNTLGYNLFLLGHYALGGLGFYLWMRQTGLGRESAFWGGLSFLTGGFLVAHKGHQAMVTTAVWLPLWLGLAARHAATGERRVAVGAGGVLALSILAGFPQMTVYGLLVLGPYWVWRGGWRRALTGWGWMVALGAALSSLQWLAVAEALPHMTRESLTFAMFQQNALPAAHLAAWFVPNLLGGMHGVPSYALDAQLVEVYLYCGLAPLVLAGLARGREARFWVGVLAVSLALSLGWEPVQQVLFRVPVYNLFRAAGRHRMEMHLAVSVLAALGLSRLAESRGRRWVFLAVGAGVGASLVWAWRVPIYDSVNVLVTDLSAAAWREQNTAWTSVTMWGPVVALLAAGMCLWRRAPGWAWGLLLVVDTGSVGRTIYDNPNTTDLYGRERRSEVKYLFERGYDAVHERILPVDPRLWQTYPLQSMLYGLQTANDYTPMWTKRYQALTGFALNGEGGAALAGRQRLLSALGVRFLLTKEPESVAAVRGAKGYRELAASREGVTVFENPGVLPRFRFVREAVGVADLGAAERGWAAGFDSAGAAMVERMTGRTPLAAGRIVAERVENAALSWRVATEGRALFVVADTWSPGWTATVDGRPARIEIVNGCMRGVFIETAGEHEIAMRFWPWSLTVGLVVTALGLLAAVSLCRRGRG
ncbi:MAG: hypothetical protein ACK55F_01400 [Acidobacteriota bacterium]|nr:YfhO family protein [Acidobacteriaceae bacterium]